VRQRIGTVLDWAKAAGFRTADNPVLGVAKGLPKQTDRDDHHSALTYDEVPAFIQRLRTSDNSEAVRLAFEFLILTASRTSEVLGAKWSEFDLQQCVWTVPANRMKAGRTHRVPLIERTLEILNRAKEIGGGSDYVFPGGTGTKPLSNMVFLMALRRMELPITAHGFRSSFRDWGRNEPTFRVRSVRQPLRMRWKTASRRRTDVVTCSKSGAS
jgi:integrase